VFKFVKVLFALFSTMKIAAVMDVVYLFRDNREEEHDKCKNRQVSFKPERH